jgi:hypothetical protein
MSDEHHYEVALLEFDVGRADPALLAKAYVLADGIDGKVKLEYIRLRVSQLKGGTGSPLLEWYSSKSANQKFFLFWVSAALILVYGLGLIPLAAFTWLEVQDRERRSRSSAIRFTDRRH